MITTATSLVLLSVSFAHASPPLTADDAVKLALERSGAVSAKMIEAEQVDMQERWRLRAPEVRIGVDSLFVGRRDRVSGTIEEFDTFDDSELALTWQPPTLRDLLDGDALDARADAEEHETELLRRELTVEVRMLHARVLSLRAELDLATRTLEAAARLEKATTDRLAAEAATTLDARLASLDRLDAAADIQEIDGELRTDEARLAALIGRTPPLQLVPGESRCVAPAESATLFADARKRSARLNELDARLRAARADDSVGWTGWVPWFGRFLIGYDNVPLTQVPGSSPPVYRPDRSDKIFGRLDVSLPFLEPLSPRRRIAELEVLRVEALVRDEEDLLRNDLAAARERLAGAAALHKVYQDGMGSVVEGSVADVEAALVAGQADTLRVAEVQSRALRARRAFIRVRLRCDEAAIDLMRLMGQ